jgi:photosystem II stability/assembly factor-like uncharacterized protein
LASSSTPTSAPRHLRGGLLFAALVLAVGSTVVAFRQEPLPLRDSLTSTGGFWSGFEHPIERNAWLRIPSAQLSSESIVGVSAADNGRSAWVTTSSGHLFRTEDGGNTWTLLPALWRDWPQGLRVSFPHAPVFLDGRRGWVIASNELWATQNGGESWLSEHLPDGQEPRALSRTGDKVYCLTQDKVLTWKGQAWKPVESLDLSKLIPLALDGSDIFAVTETSLLLINSLGATLFKWDEKGATRQPLRAEFSANEVQSVRISEDLRDYLVLTRQGVFSVSVGPAEVRRLPLSQPRPMWWAADDGMLRVADVERFLSAQAGGVPALGLTPPGWTGYALIGNFQTRRHHQPGAVLRWKQGTGWEYALTLGETFLEPAVDAKGRIWVGSTAGHLLRSEDQGRSWKRMAALSHPISALRFSEDGLTGYLDLESTYRFDPEKGPLDFTRRTAPSDAPPFRARASQVCEGSRCQDASDTPGRRWEVEKDSPGVQLIEADGTRTPQLSGDINNVLSLGHGVGLAFGSNRAIYRTDNWGRSWEPVTYAVSPAPWYYASWLVVLGLVLPTVLRRRTPRKAPVLGSQLTSDRPLEQSSQDVLGLHEIALGLSRFLRNDQTERALTIAVTGPWGAGKSSLLNLLKGDLWQYGLRPISFNAWHNEQQGNPVAAFYEAIIRDGLPPLFSPEGLWFRFQLLLKRGQRQRVKLLTTLLISCFAITYYRSAPESFDDSLAVLTGILVRVASLLGASAESPVKPGVASDPASYWFGVLVTLAGVVSVSRTLLGRLKAFGVDPAKLTAALQGSTKAADTRESVGFHARFAEDFREVTRALPYPLVILVDDLERCSPENALKMLEAVNFLVSSGDCFVVMAIHLPILEAHLRPELKTPLPPEAEGGKAPDLAANYLEKLINLEVKIPRMTQQHAVLLTSPALAAVDLVRRRALEKAERGKRSVGWARNVMGLGFFTVAAALSIWLALMVRPLMPAPAQAQAAKPAGPQTLPRPEASAPASQPALQPAAAVAVPPPERQEAPGVPVAARVEATPQAPAAVLPVPEAPFTASWFAPGVLGGLMALLLAFSKPSGGVVVTDSQGFQAALKEWMPVLLRRYTTPRALKRFLNRLRYTAMLQGNTDEDEEGPLVALIHGWLEAHSGKRPLLACLGAAARSAWTGGRTARASGPSPDLLPDAWLVAFTATLEQEAGPGLFEELRKSPELPAAPPPPAATVVLAEALTGAPAPTEAQGLRPGSPEELHGHLLRTQKLNAIQDVRKMADFFVALRERAGEPPPAPR